MSQTKKMMAHPSEHMRHASITKKVEAEMNRRREESGTYTREKILRDLEAQIKSYGARSMKTLTVEVTKQQVMSLKSQKKVLVYSKN